MQSFFFVIIIIVIVYICFYKTILLVENIFLKKQSIARIISDSERNDWLVSSILLQLKCQ